MGTYGTANGLVLVFDKTARVGKLLGLSGGELEAYFDSDGKIKWAGEVGLLSADGIQIQASWIGAEELNAYAFYRLANPIGGLYAYWNAPSSQKVYLKSLSYGITSSVEISAEQENPLAEDEFIKLAFDKRAYGYAADDSWELKSARGAFLNRIYGTQPHGDYGAIGLEISVEGEAFGLYLGRGATLTMPLSMSNEQITDLADATADTDAMNRQSGDARYIGIIGGTIDGGTW